MQIAPVCSARIFCFMWFAVGSALHREAQTLLQVTRAVGSRSRWGAGEMLNVAVQLVSNKAGKYWAVHFVMKSSSTGLSTSLYTPSCVCSWRMPVGHLHCCLSASSVLLCVRLFALTDRGVQVWRHSYCLAKQQIFWILLLKTVGHHPEIAFYKALICDKLSFKIHARFWHSMNCS